MAYIGAAALKAKLKGKVRNPGAIIRKVGVEKYGARAFNAHAAAGTSMKNVPPLKKKKKGMSAKKQADALEA